MVVKTRLRRTGAKKTPLCRIVVVGSCFLRNDRFTEEIGYYNPMEEFSVVKIDAERAKKWISSDAQSIDTVKDLFKKHGVI